MNRASHYVIEMMSPSWLFWLCGAYTQTVLGFGTAFAMGMSLFALVARFTREFLHHGWDGGRTLGRGILAALGILLTPVVFVAEKSKEVMGRNAERFGQQMPATRPEGIEGQAAPAPAAAAKPATGARKTPKRN